MLRTMGPNLALVVAAADNDVIGAGGTLPWKLPADLRRFRRLTLGKPVIMGRRTFDSLPAPLPGRTNIVLTSRPAGLPDGVVTVDSWASALEHAARCGAWASVIGGADVFARALPSARRLYLTRVHDRPVGDVWLPPWNPAEWALLASEARPPDARNPVGMTFLTYLRR